jgi:5-formyltetrahydrofolate cyclo-ligase
VYRKAEVVLAYLSTCQEPDLSELWYQDTQPKRWGLPRCTDKTLAWHECSPLNSEHVQAGSYGILEPLSTLPALDPEAVDLILVPAVACDRQGFRIGYGGGFYDRLFSHSQWASKPKVGIVFEFAFLLQVPREPWDYPVQAVCTEQGLFSTASGTDKPA